MKVATCPLRIFTTPAGLTQRTSAAACLQPKLLAAKVLCRLAEKQPHPISLEAKAGLHVISAPDTATEYVQHYICCSGQSNLLLCADMYAGSRQLGIHADIQEATEKGNDNTSLSLKQSYVDAM